MLKKLSLLFLCLTLIFVVLLPQEKGIAASNKTSSAVANENQLRVRTGPGTSFRIIGFLQKGQAVTVLDNNENWLKISTSFGEGWVAKQYIDSNTSVKTDNKSGNNGSNSTSSGTVSGDTLNVRKDPSTASTVIGKLAKGTKVTIYSKQNNWYEIRYSNQKAWVNSAYISSETSASDTQKQDDKGIIGTVTASSLSVRNGSSLNSTVIGTVNKGQSFTILEEVNNWVKIEYKSGKFGWAAGWYLEKNTANAVPAQAIKESTITILQNGSNIRKQPSVQADVLARANEGDTFSISKIENDWYEVKLKDGTKGYVAGWIVSISGSTPRIEKQGSQNYLKNKTIVLDPGHGGEDDGTTGATGTLEKELTLKTTKLLYDKLSAAGANVFLTRSSDSYISLSTRVSVARSLQADAFLSIHYDSNSDRSVRGMTGYYYHAYQKPLAETLYSSTVNETRMKNRGVRFGDFHVIRENSQKAVLIELGYLSNPSEEATLNSGLFQENAASGLFNGLARFFKEN
ncbi:MAG TPA: SH3 domain-containing protein [Neobacillus sp.]